MSVENQEGQKTVVSFIVGLLVGGLLVWAFSSPAEPVAQVEEDETTEEAEVGTEITVTTADEEASSTNESAPAVATLPVGEGKVEVADQPAGTSVALTSATYPVSEGWIGVRDYRDGQLGTLLGVARFSEEQGLVPSEIVLQRSTTAGREYAVVVYSESGDRKFNLADDVQLDSVFATFTAN
jgi:hypothetical protein